MRRGRENQRVSERFERATPIWTRSAYFHTGPRRVNGRTMRPDTRTSLTTCSNPKKNSLHSTGRPHTKHTPRPSDRSFGGFQCPDHRSDGFHLRAASDPNRDAIDFEFDRRRRMEFLAQGASLAFRRRGRRPLHDCGNKQWWRAYVFASLSLFARLTTPRKKLLRRQTVPPRHFTNARALREALSDNRRLLIRVPRPPTPRAREDLDPPRGNHVRLRHMLTL